MADDTIEQIRGKVEQIVSSKDISDTDKIAQLKQIEAEHYKPFIKQLACKKTQKELMELVLVLTDLGYLTTKLGELIGEIKYYTDAAVFYQYVITIMDEKNRALEKILNEFIKYEKSYPYEQLAHIQQLIFSAIGGSQFQISVTNVKVESDNNKNILSIIRKETKDRLQEIEDYSQQKFSTQEGKQHNQELYVEKSKKIFESIADKMQEFLAKLYNDSEKEMVIQTPCKYAVIALGSMAIKQMTPYSDLEFAILTENEDYKKSDNPNIREYFKNLSHLVNFKVINLGESIIPISRYGLDMSRLVHRAVNLDLGGKTPLGRINQHKKYDLVQTVYGMIAYVRNEQNWVSHIDKNLPYILQKVCHVHGDKQIVRVYQNNVTEFLNRNVDDTQDKLNCQIRALKLLKEGLVEIDYNSQIFGSKPKENIVKGDFYHLQPNLMMAKGRLFDVKHEIYRFPDHMVYNLGLYYGIEGDSAWDTVDKLRYQEIITAQSALNLKNAITFATTLRLKTYAHHKAQKEDMSIFSRPAKTESELKEQLKQIFHLSEEDLEEHGRLFQYFYTALPLHRKLEKFCRQYQTLSKENRQIFFKKSNFYKDNVISKGFIHYRLAQYKKAQSNFEKALDDPHNKDNLKIRHTLGNIYMGFGNNKQAIEQFQYCLNIYKRIYQDEPHLDVAASCNNLGLTYKANRQYDQAIKYFEESVKMNKLIYQNKPHPSVAASFSNLGEVYRNKGLYDQAIKYYQESLKMKKLIYQDKPHPDVAASFNNLGKAYSDIGQHDQAIKYYEESLNMIKLIYQDEPHLCVAASFNNLAEVYRNKRLYDQAIKCYEESLKINKLIYQDEPHLDVAASFNNLGEVYRNIGLYDKAIKYYEENLNMNKLIYQDEPHPCVAASFNNLGKVYRNKGLYDQAIKYYEENLKMNKLIYQDKPHPCVAASFNNLGEVYINKGLYDKAIKFYEESLKMNKLIYHDQPHPCLAASFSNLGEVYRNKGLYNQAIKYYEENLKMNKLIYQDKPHPCVAASFNNLGEVYRNKGLNDQASKFYEESLKINKLIYQDEPHLDVAASFNNLGEVYRNKGLNDQAIKFYEESLKMNKLIYQDEPHLDVAASFNNLGEVYKNKGLNDQAIKFYEESLKMNKLIYQDEPHLDVAASFNKLGEVCRNKGLYDQAIKYTEESLKMKKLIYQDELHLDVAASFNNLGKTYSDKGLYIINPSLMKYEMA
ncbi:uncharacterized protein LOC105849622 [Hydra vulgaris]|uniref:uncharacterized protein LOC105849622 n=1 Tax=Hydra vulgaris TaxID=6087 RepID=UPI001F5FB6BA|nr:uncharacterized protein LOC105849622 [Hydra vulgaris]XP_047140662.1 uncharacterized protein LOC105849622 [Hydra vulgaris]